MVIETINTKLPALHRGPERRECANPLAAYGARWRGRT
jgi:hypothetical protein